MSSFYRLVFIYISHEILGNDKLKHLVKSVFYFLVSGENMGEVMQLYFCNTSRDQHHNDLAKLSPLCQKIDQVHVYSLILSANDHT